MEPFLMTEVFSCDHDDPAVKETRRMDWETFLASISSRARTLIEGLTEGVTMNEIALKLKVNPGTVQNIRTQLAVQMKEYFGTDILHEISCLPQWCNNLAAQREQQACRELRVS